MNIWRRRFWSELKDDIAAIESRLNCVSGDLRRVQTTLRQLEVNLRSQKVAPPLPPAEIIDAAGKVGKWFKEQNVKRWQLGDVESRDYAKLPPVNPMDYCGPLGPPRDERERELDALWGALPNNPFRNFYPPA